jgi:hypothetical protein
MGISKIRNILYTIVRVLGDVSAITSTKSGKVSKRIGRRATGKATGKVFKRLFK